MAINLAKSIQEKLKVCSTCSNEGNNKTKQLVKKNVAKELVSQTIPTKSSFFRLDGLQNAIGTRSTGAEPVSISVSKKSCVVLDKKFTENRCSKQPRSKIFARNNFGLIKRLSINKTDANTHFILW